MNVQLEGFGLFVDDMINMIRFYRNVMGFDIQEQEDTKNVYLVKDGVLFLLYGKTDFEKMTGHSFEYVHGLNGHFEIAMKVENFAQVDAVYSEVCAKGAKGVMPPTTMPWGQRTCYVADPEGNLIEIGSFQP